MARRFSAGAESKAALSEGVAVSGTVTFDTTTFHANGSVAFKCDTTGSNLSAFVAPLTKVSFASTAHGYLRAWVNIPAHPSSSGSFLAFYNGVSSVCQARVDTTGKYSLWNGITGPAQIGSSSATDLTGTNVWHYVELHCMVNSAGGTTGTAELKVDGVQVALSTVENFGTTLISDQRFGWGASSALPGASNVVYLDDLAVNDTSGTAQNAFPGNGYILDLVPTADSARGANWFEGQTATTGLWQATDNKPPVGVADASSTNGTFHQIRNATNSVTAPAADYDGTLQSYTAAGAGASDTVNCVQAVAVIGNSSTTATAAQLQVVSNPAIAAGTAVSATAITSTFPTGWNFAVGTDTDAPAGVTLATAPVVRIHKATGTTRVLQNCYLAVRADLAPGATTVAIVGEADGVGVVTLTLTVTQLMVAEADGVGIATVALLVTQLIVAEADGVGVATLALTVGTASGVAIVGVANGLGAATLTLVVTHLLVAEADGIGSASLALTVTHLIVATANGVGTPTMVLTVTHLIAGTAQGVGTATLPLVVTHLIVGAASGIGVATLTLTVGAASVAITGEADGTGAATLTLTVSRLVGGQANGAGTATLLLLVTVRLVARADGVGSATFSALLFGVTGVALHGITIVRPSGEVGASVVRTAENGMSVVRTSLHGLTTLEPSETALSDVRAGLVGSTTLRGG